MACRAVYHPDDHDGADLYNKLFAAEAYVRRSAEPQRAFEAAKHIYDLAVMIRQPNIQSLLTDDAMVKKLLDIRVEE